MIRLKFLLLALVALGLWAAHVYLLTPALAARASDAARTQAERGVLLLEQRVSVQRSLIAEAGLKLAARPDLSDKLGFRKIPPNAEQLGRARTAAFDALPESLHPSAIVGLVNEAGQLWFKGDAFPRSGLDGAEGLTVLEGGPLGTKVLGKELFVYVTVALGDAEPNKGPSLVLGTFLPLQPWADDFAKANGLAALGVVAGDKSLAETGAAKASLTRARQQLKPGTADVLERGPAKQLGPLALPAFTGSVGAAKLVAARQPLLGGAAEVIAVATAEPFTGALADYQRFALFAALGFLGLVVIAALTPNGAHAESVPGMSVPQGIRGGARPAAGAPAAVGVGAAAAARSGPAPGELAMSDVAAAPEASPEDFHFGHTRVASIPASIQAQAGHGQGAPSTEGYGVAPEMPFDSPDAPREGDTPGTNSDFVSTAAYPVHQTSMTDPFGLAAGNNGGADQGFEDDHPEATRVAAIPDELLRQSALSGPNPVPQGPPENADSWMQNVAPMEPAVDEEQHHFQQVFQEYVATRERCGESGENLTFDKFAVKLRKNKDQLVQKYNCRTVRFQVYVKEGKAALKATPVKD